MVKAIIVDDEIFSRCYIETLLKKFVPEIEIVASVGTLKEAVCAIMNKKPSLVFLDIELPDGKGFEILNYGFDHEIKVIFISAHSLYAIPMYDYFPISFILKPIDEFKFGLAVRKAIESVNTDRKMRECMTGSVIPDIIPVKGFENTNLVPAHDILYMESDDSYVSIYATNQPTICACQSLTHYEELLPYPHFLRVHQSFLVNAKKITSISNTASELILCNNKSIPVSQRRRQMVKEYISSLEKSKMKMTNLELIR